MGEGSSVSSKMSLGTPTPSLTLLCVLTVWPPPSRLRYSPKWLLGHQPSHSSGMRKVKRVSMYLLTKERSQKSHPAFSTCFSLAEHSQLAYLTVREAGKWGLLSTKISILLLRRKVELDIGWAMSQACLRRWPWTITCSENKTRVLLDLLLAMERTERIAINED